MGMWGDDMFLLDEILAQPSLSVHFHKHTNPVGVLLVGKHIQFVCVRVCML